MAIYTKLNEDNLKDFFSKYNLGKLISYKGIEEGIENTNYLIKTTEGKFILTIYEKRVQENDLPFFIGLMKNLFNANFKSPEPIINKNGSYISEILNKKAAVVSFIDGNSKKVLSPENCFLVGVETAKLHMITKKLSIKRKNRLSVESWKNIYNKVSKDCSKIHTSLPKIIEKNLEEIEKNWPKNIPSGIIHADLFPDNIFFKNNKFTGIIDFYFSCRDFYIYDLMLTVNAWCFDPHGQPDPGAIRKFIQGYEQHRSNYKVYNSQQNLEYPQPI